MRGTTQIDAERPMSDARAPRRGGRPSTRGRDGASSALGFPTRPPLCSLDSFCPTPHSPLPTPHWKKGFTLIELLVVMVIISIILVFILNAGMEARRRGEERATQALITKLEMGLGDRFEALLMTRPDYNNAHLAMAAIANQNAPAPIAGYLRASVIAWYDYVKSEMPDVFYVVQNTSSPYPLNFAANPYPGTPTDPNNLGNFILPLGNSIAATGSILPLGAGNLFNPAGTGIYGASYPAAAGLYKNLGYLPQGYDGVDNNGNFLIDELAEGIGSNPYVPGTLDPSTGQPYTVSQLVTARLANHTHNTARSEMLYALLVEGRGPLGSIFNRDDFTDREVQDTDQDGLPEFVDAWGQPLQFFRWPLLYHSDIQRGQAVVQANTGGTVSWTLIPPAAPGPYLTAFQEREQDPLDLNQQLMAPAWWSSSYNNVSILGITGAAGSAPYNASGSVQAFESFFHRLTEPLGASGGPYFWDRGNTYGGRRAFYSKFLIVSGGLDQQLGVFLYSDAAMKSLGNGAATALIANENNAMPFGLDVADFTGHPSVQATSIPYNPSLDPTTPSSSDLLQAAQDDVSNQNIQVTIGIGGSG
jgi:prepilin-type N-terminal cleavage/methylation domain-containing protein